MVVTEIVLYTLFILILLCLLMKYILIFSAWRGRKTDLQRKDRHAEIKRHINVVVYGADDVETLVHVLSSLKSQSYPAHKYSINILLDNSKDNSIKVLELAENVKTFDINTEDIQIGYLPSFSLFLNKLESCEETDGFVLLDAKSILRPNFLTRVNQTLENNRISQGCLATVSPYHSVNSAVGFLDNRFKNRIVNAGQYHLLGCSNILSSCLIVPTSFVKSGAVKISPEETPFDYNFRLIESNIAVDWAPEAIVYRPVRENIKDLGAYMALDYFHLLKSVKKNVKSIFKSRKAILMTIINLLPSDFILAAFLFALAISSYYILPVLLMPSIVAVLVLLLSELFALKAVKSNNRDFKVWLISLSIAPYKFICECITFLENLFKSKPIYKYVTTNNIRLHDPNNVNEIDVMINKGKKNLSCKLLLSKDGESYLASLIFKDKKFTTKRYTTIDKALEEITKRLAQHDLKLLTCFNCGNFSFTKVSLESSKGSNGHCFYDKKGVEVEYDEVVKVWDYCKNFINVKYRNEIVESWKKSLNREEDAVNHLEE